MSLIQVQIFVYQIIELTTFGCKVTKATVLRCSTKLMFLKISQNPQENTSIGVSFLM